MNNANTTITHKTGLRHNFWTLMFLSLAGSIIYGLPYFRTYYYDAYAQMYHLSNTQMGLLGSAYGLLGVFSYAVGGILADKISAKKLIIFSLAATGLGGFLHLFFTDFHALIIIYMIWGITSLLTFWPALIKIIATLGRETEQSRVYGFFEGGRGVFEAAHTSIATVIFGIFQAQLMTHLAIQWIIVFYSVTPIALALGFIFLLKEPAQTGSQHTIKEKLTFQKALSVLRLPAIWLLILMVFTSYTFRMSITYFTPFASNIVGTSAVVAAVVTVWQQYVRPVAAPAGGFLADRFGRARTMSGGYIVMLIGTLLLYLVGSMSGFMQIAFLAISCTIVYLGMFSNYGQLYAFLTEARIPMGVYGFTVGIISTVGYLPEVLCPWLAGTTLDAYKGVQGYYLYFAFMIVMALLGLITSIIWAQTYGKRYNKQLQSANTGDTDADRWDRCESMTTTITN